MEQGLQISLKRYALSMEDKMAAGAFGRAKLWYLYTVHYMTEIIYDSPSHFLRSWLNPSSP